MTGATRAKPSYYDVLGLRPDASAGDIERAFRRELSPFMPHVVGGVAAASIAYVTLRDPAKRRAYDEANGFAQPRPLSVAASPGPLMFSGRGWHLGNGDVRTIALAGEVEAAAEPVASPLPPQAAVRPVAPVSPKLRARPADGPRPAPVLLGIDEVEDSAIGGRKGLIALGAVAGVALIGGLLGWTAGGDAGNGQKDQVVSPLPKAKPSQLTIITPAVETVAGPPAAPVAQRPQRVKRVERAAPPAESFPPAATVAQSGVVEPQIAAGEAAAAAESEQSAPPLSHSTIARTIDRIGYNCGSVSSTESGAGGVFLVTCSSGQRFRASPRNGRYRFKRI